MLTAAALWAVLAMGEVTQEDWRWLDANREALLEHFMPLTTEAAAEIRYRRYRDLYQDQPEAYIGLQTTQKGKAREWEAVVVRPDGASLQEQALRLHMGEPSAALEEILPRIRMKRLHLEQRSCPALVRIARSLMDLRLQPQWDEYVIHPNVHSLVIDASTVRLTMRVTDDDHPLARWAWRALEDLAKCGAR